MEILNGNVKRLILMRLAAQRPIGFRPLEGAAGRKADQPHHPDGPDGVPA